MNKQLPFIVFILGMIAVIVIITSFFTSRFDYSSAATSTLATGPGIAHTGQVVSNPPKKIPTTQTKSVACSLGGNIITNADGSQQVKFTWAITPGSIGFINNGAGFVQTDTDGGSSLMSPTLDTATTYSLIDGDGVATSTCTFTATPTSFAPAQ